MNQLETTLLRYFRYLDAKGAGYNFILGLFCTALIGAFDIFAPGEATHSFLYILPIGFVTWFSGIRFGCTVVLICTALWSVNNVTASPLITCWNIISTLFFFVAIAALLTKTRALWENERTLASTDPLTGALNVRSFSALADYEMLRSRREGLPFSLAYLDLDNFKFMNDTYGHATGDQLLRAIVSYLVGELRKTDLVGRLGGDEFALFLPVTDQSSAKTVIHKIMAGLSQLAGSQGWPVTFSMGVVTCNDGETDLDTLISYADALMYEVKRSGKNSIRYALYPIPGEPARQVDTTTVRHG